MKSGRLLLLLLLSLGLLSASWNFTSAASYNQWNVALEMRSDSAHAVFTNEIAQARQQIVFGLNKLTRYLVRDALVDAANRGVMIHGSPNWTYNALVSDSDNDESVVFLRHRDIARAFYLQFKQMTGLWADREESWCDLARTGGVLQVTLWMDHTNVYAVETAAGPAEGWSPWVGGITGYPGRAVFTTNAADARRCFRAVRP
ncbi:MAG: hypothetical protein JXB04_04765 [Kiritimatiellae bacterium]|nr:hypothetical protein [Kiritimatiellia bacterium]